MSSTADAPGVNRERPYVLVELHPKHIEPLLEIVRHAKRYDTRGRRVKEHEASLFREIEYRLDHAPEICPRCKCDRRADIHLPGYSCDYYTGSPQKEPQ
jgi:hypothetical protein